MEIGEIKADTPEAHPRVISYLDRTSKSDIRVGKNTTHKYNTISSTKRVNHVTTFKNAPKMFKMDTTEKIKTHIGTDYFSRIDPKKETIKVKPMVNHIG